MAALVFIGIQLADKPLTGRAGLTARDCTTGTSTVVSITTTGGTVLAPSSRRAWARIQQLQVPTDVINLAFNEGTAAVAGEGVVLATSTAPLYIEFGLNTHNPYTGEVTGIAPTATTSVLVTECSY